MSYELFDGSQIGIPPGSWVTEAIRSALDRGMVPFVCVIPISPEMLRDAAGPVDELAGDMAAKDIANAVREWQTAHVTAHEPPENDA